MATVSISDLEGRPVLVHTDSKIERYVTNKNRLFCLVSFEENGNKDWFLQSFSVCSLLIVYLYFVFESLFNHE